MDEAAVDAALGCHVPAPLPTKEVEPRIVSVIVEKGGYSGDFDPEGRYHGKGAVTFIGGNTYAGEFCHGLMHGQGEFCWTDGVVYRGEFIEGRICGVGGYVWHDGSSYKGDLSCGMRHGHGVFACAASGTQISADYLTANAAAILEAAQQEDRISIVQSQLADPHEQETALADLIAAVEVVYAGEFHPLWSAVRTVYNGQWLNGMRHGDGTLYYNDPYRPGAAYYQGQYFADQRHGRGKLHYRSGNVYDGQWAEGVKSGEGTMRWESSGEEYSGQWVSDEQTGQGVHVWYSTAASQGEAGPGQAELVNRYTGAWVKGSRNGYGTYQYASGAKYDGEWVNDKKHGFGTFTYEDGRVHSGTFRNDTYELRGVDDVGSEPASVQGDLEANELPDLVCTWVNEEVGGVSQRLNPATMAMQLSSGFLIGEAMHKMGVLRDFHLFKASEEVVQGKGSSTTRDSARSTMGGESHASAGFVTQNFARLDPALRSLGIVVGDASIMAMREAEPGAAMKLLNAVRLSPPEMFGLHGMDQAINAVLRDAVAQSCPSGVDADTLISALRNIIVRHIGDLKAIHSFYGGLADIFGQGGSPDGVEVNRDRIAMPVAALWRLSQQCGLSSSQPLVTCASLDRLFYPMEHAVAFLPSLACSSETVEVDGDAVVYKGKRYAVKWLTRPAENAKLKFARIDNKAVRGKVQLSDGSTFINPQAAAPHDGARCLLFRHFLEGLVRLTFAKFPRSSDYAVRFQELLEDQILPRAVCEPEELDFRVALFDDPQETPRLQELCQQFQGRLVGLYLNFCSGSRKKPNMSVVKVPTGLSQPTGVVADTSDHAMTVAELLACMQALEISGQKSTCSTTDSLSMIMRALYKDEYREADENAVLYFNLNTEIVFSEFVEILIRSSALLLAEDSSRKRLADKLELFFDILFKGGDAPWKKVDEVAPPAAPVEVPAEQVESN